MMKRFAATTIIAFTISATAQSHVKRTVLTVSAALALARSDNPELKKLAYQTDAARLGKWAAISGYLPHVSASYTNYFDANYAREGIIFNGSPVYMPLAFPKAQMELDASLMVFDGLATYNLYRAARDTAEATDLQYQRAKFKLDESVRMQFWRALAASDLVQVAKENIKTLQNHLKLVKVRRYAGVSTNYDVLRIEAELDDARAAILLAANNEADSRRQLLDILGVSDNNNIVLRGTLPVPDLGAVPKNLRLNLSERPDVEAQTKMELAASRKNKAALGAWFPQVDLFATEQFYHYGAFSSLVVDQPGYQNSWAYGLRLTWNVFDGGRSIVDKNIERDLYDEEKETTRRVDLTSASQFARWKRRYFYNCALYQARLQAVEKSQESVRLAAVAVRAGAATDMDELDAELELFRARAGVVQAQVGATESLAKLELALGHRI